MSEATAGIWQVIPDYDHLTAYGQYVCSVSGSPSPKGDPVFRPPHPDDVDGFHDVGADAIRQAADYLGWISPDRYAVLEETANRLHDEAVALAKELAEAREVQATLVRENVRLQDIIEELNNPIFEDIDDLIAEEDSDD